VGLVVRQVYLTHALVPSPRLFFAIASFVGVIVCYYRTKKRGEDFAKAVLDVFIVNNGAATGP